MTRGDEKTLRFTLNNGVWQADADVNSKLAQLPDNAGRLAGWRYTTDADSVETYDAQGHLTVLTNRAGLTQTLHYDTTGRLLTVSDPFGKKLTFGYNAQNRIAVATDPAGNRYRYVYDTNNNLMTVTYLDNTSRQYRYENTQNPHALTGIIDENGVRYAT